jgi:hypothetical protein
MVGVAAIQGWKHTGSTTAAMYAESDRCRDRLKAFPPGLSLPTASSPGGLSIACLLGGFAVGTADTFPSGLHALKDPIPPTPRLPVLDHKIA